MKTGAKRLIEIEGKTYDGVRSVIKEVIKRANLKTFTFEDIILSADGPLQKFAPYLKDRKVQSALWNMNNKNFIKRCGRKGGLAVYCSNEKTSPPKKNESIMPVEKPKEDSNEITATEFGERLIRYIGILKQKINTLESDISNERHLHGKALGVLRDLQITNERLIKNNHELSDRIVAINKAHKEEASKTTFKLDELVVIK